MSRTADLEQELARVTADRDAAQRENERLRNRTHEIQAEEMAKRAELDSEISRWRSRYEAARQWTEDAGLRAEWAIDPASPFWSMTSYNARSALMRLVAERDAALARVETSERERDEAVRMAGIVERQCDDETARRIEAEKRCDRETGQLGNTTGDLRRELTELREQYDYVRGVLASAFGLAGTAERWEAFLNGEVIMLSPTDADAQRLAEAMADVYPLEAEVAYVILRRLAAGTEAERGPLEEAP